MDPKHGYYADWNPERIESWALKISNNVSELVNKIMENRPYPEQAFKACIGVITLSKKYGNERLDKACIRALNYKL
jgi:hypothetical protein